MTATIIQTPSLGSLTTVERIGDVSGFEALRDEWSELLRSE